MYVLGMWFMLMEGMDFVTELNKIVGMNSNAEQLIPLNGNYLYETDEVEISRSKEESAYGWFSLKAFEVNDRFINSAYVKQNIRVYAVLKDLISDGEQEENLGVSVWIGKNLENSDPAIWDKSAFTLATYLGEFDGMDSYKVDYVACTTGLFYFVCRIKTGNSDYVYGASKMGLWDEQVNPSAKLSILEVPKPTFKEGNTFKFCASEEVFVVDFSTKIRQKDLLMYNSEHAIDPLKSKFLLTTGTYFISQVIEGCESESVAIEIIIVPLTLPDFPTTMQICACTGVPILQHKSPNGIKGIWRPEVVSAAESGIYVFTPDKGECALPVTLVITVHSVIRPNFINICKANSTLDVPVLPTVSTNGITGVWFPSVIDSTASGIYEFTPDNGQCAENISVIVTVSTSGKLEYITSENKYLSTDVFLK